MTVFRYWSAGFHQPFAVLTVHQQADTRGDAGVIGVEPGEFFFGQKSRVDEAPVDRSESEGFEAHHGPLAALDLLRLVNQHEIFNAYAVMARLVIAGLVRQDHSGLERRAIDLVDARGSFVNRQ